ncbi:MAG: ATP-binding cassette domain-containing protein, partial [Hyphomicrobiales bacterium]|nr:ATP-binding cassette domain-containing protein [Hyphomicrobiales bacterium]
MHLRVADRILRAVDGVDLFIAQGECVGIVGESGSGKTTLARAMLRLLPPVELAAFSGEVIFNGKEIRTLPDAALQAMRRQGTFSMVFQDPLGYLNPTQRVGAQIAEALPSTLPAAAARKRTLDLLREAGLREA